MTTGRSDDTPAVYADKR